MRLTIIFLLFAMVLYGCNSSQNPEKLSNIAEARVKIITFVSHEVMDKIVESTKQYLVDTLNLNKDQIEVYNPNGRIDEIQTYVRSLTSSNTDVIVAISTPTAKAVLATRHPSIPVVFSFVSDTSALGLNQYLNVCGISNVLDYKRGFELFRKILPNAKSVGVLYNPSEQNSVFSYKSIASTAAEQRPPILVKSAQFTKPEEIRVVASSIQGIDAFYVGGDNKLVSNFETLINVANARNIPVFASDEGSVRKGAIGAYSIDYAAFGHETGKLVGSRLLSNSKFRKILMYNQGREVVLKNPVDKR